MKRTLITVLILSLIPACLAEGSVLGYRFVDADEAAELRLSNRNYFDNLTRNDLNYRLQKLDATLAEYEAFAAEQTLDFTDAEKARIEQSMALIQNNCAKRGYTLPPTDDIVFAKSTMADECYAEAYTHGTQIYIGESMLQYGFDDNPEDQVFFDTIMAHELFHCLTRNHPDFRAAMYAILGFTIVEEDYEFSPEVMEKIIANPDVEHHNSYAAFEINGKMTNCTVVFTTSKPYRKPGDSFFDVKVTGLVPIDDMTTMYTADEAANFWDVFGRNTDYVIDPEEVMADNFSYAMIYGPDGKDYETPEIIQAIDKLLKAGFAAGEAA